MGIARAVQGETMIEQEEPSEWKSRLQGWAERNGVSPADFSRATGYSYNYAYQLLRGSAPVTNDTLGRIVRAYGADVAAQISGQGRG